MPLEVASDERFDRWIHRVQRVCWALMALAVAAAALGLFGNGVLGEATAASAGTPALTVRYDRLARYLSPQELVVEVRSPPDTAPGMLEIAVSRGFLADVRLNGVTPEPQEVAVEGDRYVYRFPVDGWSEPVRVHFELEADHWGRLHGSVQARAGGAESGTVSIRQWVYP